MPSKTDCAELCRELQAEICRLKREFSAGKTYSASTQSPNHNQDLNQSRAARPVIFIGRNRPERKDYND